ncbi:MAG: chorismate-binding protein [Brasilonema angustatum HA4187-MV1]|jgi:para-aminobenzoate synthetase component 1|nr:chorismate-binding protein [Brasilonema angustatum HA4187-MV1]
MLVSLKRNNLGRLPTAELRLTREWKTVAVNELLIIEDYSNLMHLVSNIKGSLKSDCNVLELFGSCSFVGTFTGCPKVCWIEMTEELEPMRRSLFFCNLELLSDQRQLACTKGKTFVCTARTSC